MEVLKPGDTVYIRVDHREVKVVSIDGDNVTVKPGWPRSQRTLSRYELHSSNEWLDEHHQMQASQRRYAMERILGDGQIDIEGLASKLNGVSNTISGAENNQQTQAVRSLVKVVGLMLGKFDGELKGLKARIAAQDKEIAELFKYARGERRL